MRYVHNCERKEYINKGSDWRLREVLNLSAFINENQPLRGSSYKDLPKFTKNKKTVINIKNFDNECFRWAVLRAVHQVSKNKERVSDLKHTVHTLSWG